MKHTQGPWRTGDRFNTVFGPPNGTPSPQTIATVAKGNEANARLIAAAPELLEQFEQAMIVLEAVNSKGAQDTAFIMKCRAVIAKAKGGGKGQLSS